MREESLVVMFMFGSMMAAVAFIVWYGLKDSGLEKKLGEALTTLADAAKEEAKNKRQSDPQNRPLIYLACPYSGSKDQVEERVKAFALKVAEVEAQGKVHVISPVMNHLVIQYASVPGSWEYWRSYSLTLLARCDGLYVLRLPGWTASEGVKGEIAAAEARGIPITYLDP